MKLMPDGLNLIIEALRVNASWRIMVKKPPKQLNDTTPIPEADRIRYLLANCWAGNQNQMARDLGCSQSSLSRVVSGKLRPGKRLLKLITDFGVSPKWLFQGIGEPLAERPRPPAGVDFRLPVVTYPLAGPPGEHRDRLQGHEFPVAPALFAASRCWYEIPEGTGILRNEQARLMPRDLLLLEYDLGRFHDLFEMDRRIAVAWVDSPQGQRHLEVGVLQYSSGPDPYLIMIVGEPDLRRWKDVQPVAARIVTKDRTSGRIIQLGSTTELVLRDRDGHIEAIGDNLRQPVSYGIGRADVVAVCVGMFRR